MILTPLIHLDIITFNYSHGDEKAARLARNARQYIDDKWTLKYYFEQL